MFAIRTLRWPVAACALCLVLWLCQTGAASASSLQCASTNPTQTETTPTPDSPCWVDSDGPPAGTTATGAEQDGNPQYPFGSDGGPVDPESEECTGPPPNTEGLGLRGAGWTGDFIAGGASCYLEVTSFAFRAWNRGLAATAIPDNTNHTEDAYGVWLYNGTDWFPDPTFPGSATCPGSTVLWAGKLDYWLIGSPTTSALTGASGPTTTLCHFDGQNLYWQALTLPAATMNDLPLNPSGSRIGGITSATCFAWNNCWFLGTDGIRVHWDGEELSDASDLISDRPWLQGDFATAVGASAGTGQQTGLAFNDDQSSTSLSLNPLPVQPDGTPPAQAFSYAGSSWSPRTLPQDLTGEFANPYQTTAVTDLAQDSNGDTWAAAQPVDQQTETSGPQNVPLVRLDSGMHPSCEDNVPTYQVPTSGVFRGSQIGLSWTSLAVAPDGSVVAGGAEGSFGDEGAGVSGYQPQPELIAGSCGSSSTATFGTVTFTAPTPTGGSGTVPADQDGAVTAVAAAATNDEWVATGAGSWQEPQSGGQIANAPMAPHIYHYTGGPGSTPDAPAGDDNETRPSLFTLSPPIYQVSAATIIKGTVTTTIRKKGKRKRIKLAPAIYGLHTHLVHSGKKYTLELRFRVRRPVTVGLAVLHHGRIVARTRLERFRGHQGVLSVRLSTKAWPTGLKLLTPSSGKHKKRSR